MSFKAVLLAGIVSATLALPVSAQVSMGALGDVDAWGVGYLDRGEPALPTNMWKASRTDDILPLMRNVRTRSLTPSERKMLRRVVLTPASRPNGKDGDKVLAERARIMYELGEARAAADLMGKLPDGQYAFDADQISTDLQLALGNEATACRPQSGKVRTGQYWTKLRAVCAALQNNNAGAQLAIEIAQGEGVNDDWLFAAVFAASGEEGLKKPPARFDSGLNLAISNKADLKPPVNSITTSSRADLAAAMALREKLPPALRAQAAGIAAESGLITAADHRAVYEALMKEDGYTPGRPIDLAISTMADRSKSDADKARAVASAIRSGSGSAARFAAVADLLRSDVQRMPKNADTARHALIFARASLATGDVTAAARWSGITGRVEGVEAPDPFESAWIDGLVILGGGDRSPASVDAVTDRLVEHASDKNRQKAAAQLFALWAAFDVTPPAAARAVLVQQAGQDDSESNGYRAIAIKSAAEANAAGEAILSILNETKGDPTRLAVSDLVITIEALRKLGADDVARQLALEATGYWKTAL